MRSYPLTKAREGRGGNEALDIPYCYHRRRPECRSEDRVRRKRRMGQPSYFARWIDRLTTMLELASNSSPLLPDAEAGLSRRRAGRTTKQQTGRRQAESEKVRGGGGGGGREGWEVGFAGAG
nr:unnamed protein product [Digitaria exilis]